MTKNKKIMIKRKVKLKKIKNMKRKITIRMYKIIKNKKNHLKMIINIMNHPNKSWTNLKYNSQNFNNIKMKF